MKIKFFARLSLFLVLCLFLLSGTAFAQNSGKSIDPEVLLNDDSFFPLKGYTNTFTGLQGYVNEVGQDGIIHQFYMRSGKATDIQMSLFPAVRSSQTTNRFLVLDKSWYKEFHAGITLQRTESIPAGTGGLCWVRYTNFARKGSESESGIILYPGGEAYAFGPHNGTIRYEKIADLSELDPSEEIRLEFIRIDGVSYFYADGNFLFSYADGIPGEVSFEAGALLSEGGNRVHCDFDDFSMTIRAGG